MLKSPHSPGTITLRLAVVVLVSVAKELPPCITCITLSGTPVEFVDKITDGASIDIELVQLILVGQKPVVITVAHMIMTCPRYLQEAADCHQPPGRGSVIPSGQ